MTGIVIGVFVVTLMMMFRFTINVVRDESLGSYMQSVIMEDFKHLLVALSENSTNSLSRKKEPINCKEHCEEVMATFQPTNPLLVKVLTEYHIPDSLDIHSNKERIRDILIELLDNANKFTQKGSITLTCSQNEDGIVSFAVSDTGIGIAECDRERIFTPFTKVNYFTEGVGLGLSLSKQTAQKLGGDLILDNSYHGGSRFVLTLKV